MIMYLRLMEKNNIFLKVKIQLEDATGLDLHLSNPVSSFCVKPIDSVVHEYILRPRVLGDINITVSAAIDANYPDPCGPDTLVYTRYNKNFLNLIEI